MRCQGLFGRGPDGRGRLAGGWLARVCGRGLVGLWLAGLGPAGLWLASQVVGPRLADQWSASCGFVRPWAGRPGLALRVGQMCGGIGWWLCGTRPARSWPAWGYLPSDRPLGGVGRPGSVSCGSASWWTCLPGIGWAGLAHREWRSLGWPGRGRPAERRPASGPPALGLAAQGRPAGGPPRSQAAVGGAPVGRCGALTLQPCGSFNSTVPLVVAYLVFASCSGVCAVGVSPFCVLLASCLYYVCILFIFCLFCVYFLLFSGCSAFFLFFVVAFFLFFFLFFCA